MAKDLTPHGPAGPRGPAGEYNRQNPTNSIGSNTVLMRGFWQDLKVTPANVAEVAKILKADEENQGLDQVKTGQI